MLYEVSPADPVTLAVVGVVLLDDGARCVRATRAAGDEVDPVSR